MERKRPIGFVAKCQCGVIVGAMDYSRTSSREAGETLGRWLHSGCTVEPRFAGTWSVDVGAYRCGHNAEEVRPSGKIPSTTKRV